jgi:glycosyltransferase involved in cell wall biosynthesis
MIIEEPLVSIIIPIYGVELYIKQCIESVLKQTYSKLQIILVNDGSKDNCGEICNYYSKNDSRIIVIHKENEGLVNARKSGLDVANGDFVAFIDGDDWVGENFIYNLIKPTIKHKTDFTIAGYIREFYGKEDKIYPKLPTGYYNKENLTTSVFPYALYNGIFFQHGISTYVWNKLFKHSTLKKHLSIIDKNIVMGEDAALTYPYLFNCNSIYITDATDYYYRQRPNSIVKSVPNLKLEYSQLSLLFKHLKKNVSNISNIDLEEHLKLYFYSQILIRSGGVINSDIRTIPFSNMESAKNIVIYSSGSFGQHLISSIQKLKHYNIISWLDEDHVESQIFGLEVNSIDYILEINFDLVLIASIDEYYTKEAVNKLIKLGISMDKISCFKLDLIAIEKAIIEIGFDINTFNYKDQIYALKQ